MHLTHKAISKAQSLIITGDLYAPTGAGTAEPCRGGECWRTTQFWPGEQTGKVSCSSWEIKSLSPGGERLLGLRQHKQGENLLSLYPGDNCAESCLNISRGTCADHWQGVLLQDIWEVLRREQNILESFFFLVQFVTRRKRASPSLVSIFTPTPGHSPCVWFEGDVAIPQMTPPCTAAKGKLSL